MNPDVPPKTIALIRNSIVCLAALLSVFGSASTAAAVATTDAPHFTQYVNPFIGTAPADARKKGGGANYGPC